MVTIIKFRTLNELLLQLYDNLWQLESMKVRRPTGPQLSFSTAKSVVCPQPQKTHREFCSLSNLCLPYMCISSPKFWSNAMSLVYGMIYENTTPKYISWYSAFASTLPNKKSRLHPSKKSYTNWKTINTKTSMTEYNKMLLSLTWLNLLSGFPLGLNGTSKIPRFRAIDI